MADTIQKPLVFNDWSNGMADSPALGVGMLSNVDIDTATGALMPSYQFTLMSPTVSSSTFTWNNGTSTGTITGSFPELFVGTCVQLTNSGGALPTGLSAATNYFITNIIGSTFQLSTTLHNAKNNTAITTSGAGSGTNTMVTVNFGTATAYAFNPGSIYMFVLDNNGNLWYTVSGGSRLNLISGTTLTANAGNGLCGFTNSSGTFYLFVYRNAAIDVMNASGDTFLEDPIGNSAWTTTWQTMNAGAGSGASHYSILGQDNIVYFCDTRYVGSIQEKPGQAFAPGTSSTFTYNNQALTLPSGEQSVWLEQLAINLLVAGATYNYVYPWDRSSISFSFPWLCPETNVTRLKNIGNTIYISAGVRGNIYKSQGYSVVLAKKIPETITQSTAVTQVTVGSFTSKNGSLLIGLTTAAGTGVGIWELASDMTNMYMYGTGGKLSIDNTLINGTSPTVLAIKPGGTNEEFYFAGGVGEFSTMSINRTGVLGANVNAPLCFYQSGLRAVGNKISKAKYSRLEIQLLQPMQIGSSIRLSTRSSITASFAALSGGTTNGTFTGDGTTTSYTQDIGLHDLENLQLQVELAGSGSGPNAVKLMSVVLYP